MKTSTMLEIEIREGKSIEEVLIEKVAQHGSMTAAAKEIGIRQGTLSLWCQSLGLRVETRLVKVAQ